MPLIGSSPIMALRTRRPSASSMIRSAQALDLNLKSMTASWAKAQFVPLLPASVGSWIASLSLWLAWKVATRRASIGISSPVRGLRPGRAALVRIWKLPKPEIFTSCPWIRLSTIKSKNASTMSLDSRLFRPICSNSRSARCALVNAGVSRLSTEISIPFSSSTAQARAQLFTQICHHGLHDRVELRIGQRRFTLPQRQAHSQTLFSHSQRTACGIGRGAVNVKQHSRLQQTIGRCGLNGLHQLRMGDRLGHDHGNVALHRLLLGHALGHRHRSEEHT